VAACLVVLTLAGGADAADVVDAPVPVASDAGGTLARPVPIDDVAPVDVPRPPAGAAPSAWPASLPAPGPVVWLAAGALVLLAARAASRRAARPLPEEVFALLGEAPMGGTHVARVVRFGPKTVLVGVSGSTCTTLAEIEDPHVTAALAAACRGPAPAPPTAVVDLLRTAISRSLAPARRVEAVR
jgi:hypothetical protein